MTQHFIHYVPRRVFAFIPKNAESPWFAKSQDLEAGFRAPRFHITRSRKGAVLRVHKGDVIWIVGQLFSPWGMLAPSIDARISVRDILHESDGRITFSAAKTSAWLPLTNATDVLRKLRTVTIDGHGSALIGPEYKQGSAIGRHLQSMRQLESGQPLVDWADELVSRPVSFISYRIRDGTEAAFREVSRLMKHGDTVFWDRWSLPRRLVEGREHVSDAALDRHLMKSLRASFRVLGIESPAYREPSSYAAKECAAARKLGIYQPVDAPGTLARGRRNPSKCERTGTEER